MVVGTKQESMRMSQASGGGAAALRRVRTVAQHQPPHRRRAPARRHLVDSAQVHHTHRRT